MGIVRRKWTPEEDKLFYDGLSVEEIMKKTGRNFGSVDSRRYKLFGQHEAGYAHPQTRSINSYPAPTDTKKYLFIDGQKLQNEFKKRGLLHREIAETLGIGVSSISTYTGGNYIAKAVMLGLEQAYNIKYEDIKLEEPEVVEEPEEVIADTPAVVQPIDYNKLAEIIERAVYSAVSRAWNEPTAISKGDYE